MAATILDLNEFMDDIGELTTAEIGLLHAAVN